MIRTALALALMAATAAAQEETFWVGHSDKLVNITFEAHADIESIVGHTMKATGEIRMDAARETGSVSITVPVREMTTGIKLRDEHMRSAGWLDEAKFAEISFTSKKIEKVKDARDRFTVTGDFTMHGVARETTVEVAMKALPADASKKLMLPDGKVIRFTAEFSVKLSDHGVKVPDMAVGKVENEWKVKMTLFASTAKLPEKK